MGRRAHSIADRRTSELDKMRFEESEIRFVGGDLRVGEGEIARPHEVADRKLGTICRADSVTFDCSPTELGRRRGRRNQGRRQACKHARDHGRILPPSERFLDWPSQDAVEAERRLTKSKPVPDLRYHYRVIAAALAIDAAKLLPNDSEELADVVNCAGLWVKDEEEKLGNRYFSILQNRAARSAIGRAATARRWFVDQPGPWSLKEKQTEEKMRQELKIPAEN